MEFTYSSFKVATQQSAPVSLHPKEGGAVEMNKMNMMWQLIFGRRVTMIDGTRHTVE